MITVSLSYDLALNGASVEVVSRIYSQWRKAGRRFGSCLDLCFLRSLVAGMFLYSSLFRVLGCFAPSYLIHHYESMHIRLPDRSNY